MYLLLQVIHERVHGRVMLWQMLPHGGRNRGRRRRYRRDGRHVRRVRERRHAPLRRRVRLIVDRTRCRPHPGILEIHGGIRPRESLEKRIE